MNDLTIIFFGASVAVCLLAIVTFFVVVSYHKALKKQRELEEELNTLKLKGTDEVNKILLQAQAQASEIIKNAQVKSQEYVKASEVFSEDFRLKFQSTITQGSNQILQNISNDISQQVQSEMKSFAQALNKNIEVLVDKTQKELDEYKKQEIARLESKIFKIVEDTTKKSISKSLTKTEHEKLIMDALEEAKKQNVL